MAKRKSKFHFTINDGPEQVIKTKSGIYVEAVAAIPAVFGVDSEAYPLTIKIWVPELLPDYGPYTHYIDAPGGRVGAIHSFWDGTDRVCYSTA